MVYKNSNKIISRKKNLYKKTNKFKTKKQTIIKQLGGSDLREQIKQLEILAAKNNIETTKFLIDTNIDFYKIDEPIRQMLEPELEAQQYIETIYEKFKKNSILKSSSKSEFKDDLIQMKEKFNALKTSIDQEDSSGILYLNTHGGLTSNETFTVPDNVMLCFLVPYGKLGVVNTNFAEFFKDEHKANRDFFRTLLEERINLTDNFNRPNKPLAYKDCFDNSLWYYPGQKVYDSQCSMYIQDIDNFYSKGLFKFFHYYILEKGQEPMKIEIPEAKGPYFREEYTMDKLNKDGEITFDLSKFITDMKNALEQLGGCKNILFILKFCNSFLFNSEQERYHGSFDQGALTDDMRKYTLLSLQYESIMYHTNKYIIDENLKTPDISNFEEMTCETDTSYIYVPLTQFNDIKTQNINLENLIYQPFSRKIPKIKKLYEELNGEFNSENPSLKKINDKGYLSYFYDLSFIKLFLIFYKLLKENNYLENLEKYSTGAIDSFKKNFELKYNFIYNLFYKIKLVVNNKIINNINSNFNQNHNSYLLTNHYQIIYCVKLFELFAKNNSKQYELHIKNYLSNLTLGYFNVKSKMMSGPMEKLFNLKVFSNTDIHYDRNIYLFSYPEILVNNLSFSNLESVNFNLLFTKQLPKNICTAKTITFSNCNNISYVEFTKDIYPYLNKIILKNSVINSINIKEITYNISNISLANSQIIYLNCEDNDDLILNLNNSRIDNIVNDNNNININLLQISNYGLDRNLDISHLNQNINYQAIKMTNISCKDFHFLK